MLGLLFLLVGLTPLLLGLLTWRLLGRDDDSRSDDPPPPPPAPPPLGPLRPRSRRRPGRITRGPIPLRRTRVPDRFARS